MGLLAAGICLLAILALFALARDRSVKTSPVLWIPVIWLSTGSSRNLSEWLRLSPPTDTDRYLEGNPLDRTFLSALMAIGVIALIGRRRQVWTFVRSNAALIVYFAYCGVSALWSDYPDVSFKRWFRALGDVVMVLVVLTDADRLAALKRLFARAGFVLLPISILLIRYYPDIGRTYSRGGAPSWTGVTTDKNALGMICLIFGLASAWHLLREKSRGTKPYIAHGVLVLVALYLLQQADSATAFACFFLGGAVMWLTTWPLLVRKPVLVHLLVIVVLAGAISALFGSSSNLVGMVGRNSTLTGRTEIWRIVFDMTVNPVVGAGYETFWLGDRIKKLLSYSYASINQAHNGYIEIFLNLGYVGVILLALVIIAGYRKIVSAVGRQADAGSLRLAYFVAAIIYNFTEAGFKMMHPVWVCFLLATGMAAEAPVAEGQASVAGWRFRSPPTPSRAYPIGSRRGSDRTPGERRMGSAKATPRT